MCVAADRAPSCPFLRRYDASLFPLFVEVFKHLPIAATVGGRVMVIHGGLFHRDGVTLDHLDAVDRAAFCATPAPEEEAALRHAEVGRCVDGGRGALEAMAPWRVRIDLACESIL